MRQEELLAYLRVADGPQSVKQICEAFGIAYPEKRSAVTQPLGKLKKWESVRAVGKLTTKGAEAILWEAVI